MLVVRSAEIVLGAQVHAMYAPRDPFSQWVTCGNEMARNHPKDEFWTQSSGLGMFIAKCAEIVLEAKTHALYAPRDLFLQWVTCGNEMARNHPKMSFGPKVVDWACSLRKKKKWFRW